VTTSNAWAEFADVFIRTREAHLEHEKAKSELKSLMLQDAQQRVNLLFTIVGAKHSKSSKVAKCLGDPNQVNDAAAVSEARQTRVLKKAAFTAAVTDANLMPLDFFLTLMRQADLPLKRR
jgi:hypothetical protein